MSKLSSCVLIGLFGLFVSQEKECENNPYYAHRPAYIHKNTAKALANSTYRQYVLETPKYQKSYRVYIYDIQSPKKGGQQFIICTTPKAGSTRIRMLLKRILSPEDRNIYSNVYGRSIYNPIEMQTPEYVEKILNNASIPRFVVVRNPYVRAISMYTDKFLNDGPKYIRQNLFPKIKNSDDISFKDFVEALYQKIIGFKVKKKSSHIDRHFVPQSSLCGLDVGLTYNYILKQEEIDDWFDCFIDRIDARDVVSHGWPDENKCYFSTTKNPCNGPRMENGIMKNIDQKTTKHHTGSLNLLQKYYSDRSLVSMIAELYQDDIINFGYEFL